jgi:hypothetical protein
MLLMIQVKEIADDTSANEINLSHCPTYQR